MEQKTMMGQSVSVELAISSQKVHTMTKPKNWKTKAH